MSLALLTLGWLAGVAMESSPTARAWGADNPSAEPSGQVAPAEDPRGPRGKEPASPERAAISPFQYPARAAFAWRLMEAGMAKAQQGETTETLRLFEQAVAAAPFLPDAQYNLACKQALAGQTDKAFASLTAAVEAEYMFVLLMQRNDDLKTLRNDPRFEQLVKRGEANIALAKPRWPKAAPVVNGVATVSAANARWDRQTGQVRVALESLPGQRPEVEKTKTGPVVGLGEVSDRLAQWYAEGTAAGNFGDFYDNCDRDHSNMRRQQFPQLTFIEYAPEVANETGYGLQVSRLYNGVVLGNSSTARTAGPYWRSNPRAAYTSRGGAVTLSEQYASNHIYFYPEHRDHDPGHNGKGADDADPRATGHGDVYAANTPYMVISQGSSGSDQAFLRAFACALAALRPEVKQKLIATGTIAPTLQQVFRRSNQQVKQPEDYLSGAAHPTVFDGSQLDVLKMVELAHDLTLETLPPVSRLDVITEDEFVLSRDCFDVGEREKLFDTSAAVARVWRSTAGARSYVLSAEGSHDLAGKPLSFHWVLLRGNAEQVKIEPAGGGRQAKVTLRWQPRQPIAAGSKMESNRIEIGLFADNGSQLSAPAFFCVNTLDNEERTYNDQGQPLSITYRGDAEKGNYVDPAWDIPKSWRDDYRHDADGTLLGWTRTRGEAEESFTADGALIEQTDALGRATVARTVRYVAEQPRPNQPAVLRQQLANERLHYTYNGPTDLRGHIERREAIADSK